MKIPMALSIGDQMIPGTLTDELISTPELVFLAQDGNIYRAIDQPRLMLFPTSIEHYAPEQREWVEGYVRNHMKDPSAWSFGISWHTSDLV